MPKIKTPDKLICGITHELFKNPVKASDNFTYELDAINKWFSIHQTSPLTREAITSKFIVDEDIKNQLNNFLTQSGLCTLKDFHAAIASGDVNNIQKLNYLEDYLETRNDAGETPLIIAIKNGFLEVVRLLLSENIDVEAKSEFLCQSPLMIAAEGGCVEIVKLLLDNNASPKARDFSDRTALFIAAANNHLDIVKVLCSKTNNCNDKVGRSLGKMTSLHVAVKNGHQEVINFLLSQNADPNARDDNEDTPLHIAAKEGFMEIVVLLLAKNADLEAKNYMRNTPLHEACMAIKMKMVTLLVSKGANRMVENVWGDTPMMVLDNVSLERNRTINEKINKIKEQQELIHKLEMKPSSFYEETFWNVENKQKKSIEALSDQLILEQTKLINTFCFFNRKKVVDNPLEPRNSRRNVIN